MCILAGTGREWQHEEKPEKNASSSGIGNGKET
jgi:hypothetical protein